MIGGGIGVPPLVETAKQLHAKGVYFTVTSVIGFCSTRMRLFGEAALYGDVYVTTTDDGSYGRAGYVSTVVDELDWRPDAVYSCGAPGMLRYVDSKFEHQKTSPCLPVHGSTDGLWDEGLLRLCSAPYAIRIRAANQRVCEDGPVFETGTIVIHRRKS